jgi:hypothetical protein
MIAIDHCCLIFAAANCLPREPERAEFHKDATDILRGLQNATAVDVRAAIVEATNRWQRRRAA